MRLKKLLVCGLSAIMLMSMTITTFAASLTSDEQSIISALQTAGVPTDFVTQAQNYLASDAVTVTADQATAIKAKITEAKTTAGDITSFAKLSDAQKTTIANDLVAAGKVIGVTVSVNATSNTISATDASGKTILNATMDSSGNTVIKATGVNMNTTIAIISALVIALAACGVVVVSKKRVAGQSLN